MLRRLLLTLAIAALAAPAAAPAATVETRIVERTDAAGLYHQWEVSFVAGGAERNDVELTRLGDRTVRVTDRGAPVAAGERCRRIDEHSAECTIPRDAPNLHRFVPYLSVARVLTHGLDDVVRSEGEIGGVRLLADGGPGDDVLLGSTLAADELDGGGGRDELIGRGNADVLTDGDTSGAADADVLDGGTVSYAGRTRGVVVDLEDLGPAGEPGEGDVLRSIEGIVGGSGDDRLRGTDGFNIIEGGAGDDAIDGEGTGDSVYGGAGNDRLHGDDGDDYVDGGPGLDHLQGDAGDDHFAGPGGGDLVLCGAGRDTVTNPVGTLVVPGCEQLGFGWENVDVVSLNVEPAWSARGGILRFGVDCVRPEPMDGECASTNGTVRLTTRTGAAIGFGRFFRRRFAQYPRGLPLVAVRLTPTGRRLAARPGGTLVRVTVDAGRALSWRIRLRG